MAALHAARKFDDSVRAGQQRALRPACVVERLRRERVHDDDGVNRRLTASTELPRGRIAFFSVAQNVRALLLRDAFLKLDRERAEHLRRQPERGKAAGGERDVQHDRRLQFLSARRRRPRLRRRDGRTDRGQPSLRPDGIVKLGVRPDDAVHQPVAAQRDDLASVQNR